MDTARYRVSAHSFVTDPALNCIIVYQLSTDNLFYAKVNVGGIVSVLLLGSGASLTGFLYNNIDVTALQNHIGNDATLAAVQSTGNVVLTELHYPNLTSAGIYLKDNSSLLVLDMPVLVSSSGITIESNDALPNIALDALETVSNNLTIFQNDDITSVSLLALTAVVGNLEIEDNILLTSVDISALESAALVKISDSPSLQTIGISATDANYTDINFRNNALNLVSEIAILNRLIASGELNGTLRLEGGTNAAFNGAATALKNTLIANGWTVTNN